MNKNISVLFVYLFLIFSFTAAYAQDSFENSGNDSQLPVQPVKEGDVAGQIPLQQGMELRKVGAANMILPKGTRVYKEGPQWFVEGPDDYVARNFDEIMKRLDKLEKDQKELSDNFEKLKEEMSKPQ